MVRPNRLNRYLFWHRTARRCGSKRRAIEYADAASPPLDARFFADGCSAQQRFGAAARSRRGFAIALRRRSGPAFEGAAETGGLGVTEQGSDVVQRGGALFKIYPGQSDALFFQNVGEFQAMIA